MNIGKDLIFKEIDTIDVFDPATGDYLFSLDELTAAAINQTEETKDITGKGGRLLSRTKTNKGVTVTGTNGMVSYGLMALQTGGDFVTGEATILWTDYLTVGASNTATTKYVAVGTAGAEIVELYVKDANGNVTAELTQASSASSGKFAYDPSTKALTFHTDITEGTEVVAIYKRTIATGDVLTNESDKYAGKAMLYINGLAEDRCSKTYRVQFFFPKVDFSGQFNLEFGDNPTVHSFEATAMAGSCGSGSKYYTYTVFGADVEDAT